MLNCPYPTIKKVYCPTCAHIKECTVRDKSKVSSCDHHETLEEMISAIRKRDNLVWIVKTPAGAEYYLDKINDVLFMDNMDTGNSKTHFNLGARETILLELQAIIRVLSLDNYIELIIYLTTIKETGNVKR